MDTDLLLPVLALLGAGAAAGFAGGLFGIGGGFVVVPALMVILPLFGTDPTQLTQVAVGTSLATIIFTSIRSVMAHAKRESVDFTVLRSWAPWVVLGTIGGSLIAGWVSSPALAAIFGVAVLIMSIHFLLPILRDRQIANAMPGGATRAGIAGGLGMLSALLGIGGGTIATMVMTLCGSPIHRAIGTASGMGTIIAIPGTIGFMAVGFGVAGLPWGSVGYVNLPIGAAIIVTAVLFAPLGVAAAHKLSPTLLRTVFGCYLVTVGITMLTNAGGAS